ncbi:hypothetical protein DFA_07921 [Cavenderia fasciculata]|uniref:Uncharacterized protein n=1 Tax=Cavenderia fasciculata TaxID=261658 RepID=F4Q426_CACFS|nr:uncharacterized protein DFA_07921 [Cavenderia fasciculata]EGG16940.1 hypothetical protein DFA_07921 [Cavenderia fasciculata]|eukprot:XP_004355414.1 hypothetical protein DFA_07921 [Cavenderia fasciculata]
MCIVFILNNKPLYNSSSSSSQHDIDCGGSSSSGSNSHNNGGIPFIILNNRDEVFARPTQRLNKWVLGDNSRSSDTSGGAGSAGEDHDNNSSSSNNNNNIDIYAGRDLKFGGTWFGINNYGSFAILLNYTVPKELISPDLKSRGLIIPEFLKHPSSELKDYIETMQKEKHLYPPLNLVVGNVKTGEIYYICNYNKSDNNNNMNDTTTEAIILGDQVVTVSNGNVNDKWPKMKVGELLLQEYFDNLNNNLNPNQQGYDINNIPLDGLWNILSNNQKPDLSDIPKVGLEETFAKQCSSVFVEEAPINGTNYGTRTSSILIVDNQFKARFIEKDYVNPGITDITFQLDQ